MITLYIFPKYEEHNIFLIIMYPRWHEYHIICPAVYLNTKWIGPQWPYQRVEHFNNKWILLRHKIKHHYYICKMGSNTLKWRTARPAAADAAATARLIATVNNRQMVSQKALWLLLEPISTSFHCVKANHPYFVSCY
jgi:hypothetical protein